MTILPPGLVTRTISLATSKGLGANIAPKMLTTRSNEPFFSSFRSVASPSWNLQFVSPSADARLFPASTRFLAISTPSTSAPRFADGSAVVPSPHPRSRTLSPFVTPSFATSASPLSRMAAAIRVKSPFSQSALFGFIAGSFREVLLRTARSLSQQCIASMSAKYHFSSAADSVQFDLARRARLYVIPVAANLVSDEHVSITHLPCMFGQRENPAPPGAAVVLVKGPTRQLAMPASSLEVGQRQRFASVAFFLDARRIDEVDVRPASAHLHPLGIRRGSG